MDTLLTNIGVNWTRNTIHQYVKKWKIKNVSTTVEMYLDYGRNQQETGNM